MQTSSILDKAASGVENLSAGAQGAVEQAADVASSAAHQFAARGRQLAATGERWTGVTRDYVRRHPIASVGVALGVGVLLSMLRRPSRD